MNVGIDSRWHFGIPVLVSAIDDVASRRKSLIEHLAALRERDRGLRRSNQNGWHSANDLFKSTDPGLRWLVERIYATATGCIRQAEGERFQGDILMTDCWANISDAGSWHAPHAHLPNEWSGVFYLSVEETLSFREAGSMDGDILFLNPLPAGALYGRPPFANYTPRDGQMFLFPGYLLHMVAPHSAPVPRISLAFNFKLRRHKPREKA